MIIESFLLLKLYYLLNNTRKKFKEEFNKKLNKNLLLFDFYGLILKKVSYYFFHLKNLG